MSILDKKHILTINLDDSSIKCPSSFFFYNTDKNISNLYVKIKKNNDDGVGVELSADDLNDVTVKLTAIKPKTNQTRDMIGILTEELTDQSCAIYKFELSQEFTDQVGPVICEFELSNASGEKVTIDAFSYEIKSSKLTGLNDEIESNPDLPVLKALIEEVKETAQTVNNIDNVNVSDIKTYSNKKIEEKFKGVNAQFKDTAKDIDISIANASMIGYSENQEILKPLITFVDDDGRDGTYETIKEICSTYGIPFVIALYSKSTITDEQGLELQNNYGCEITGHSMSHSFLHTLNEEQLEYELGENKRELLKKGYNVRNFVYPQNTHNELVHKVARKYYNCACTVGTDQTNEMNKVTNFGLLRVAMGTFCQEGKDNLDYYKSMVDKCIQEKSWLIFMTHVSWETHTSAMTKDIKDTIEYIKSKNVDIVTLQEGWEHFGNKVEIRSTMGETIITNKGQVISTVFDRPKINAPIFNAPITEYARGKMTRTNFLSSDNTGFPHNSTGVLETYRNIYTSYNDNSYQLWHPYNSNKIYKRIWDDTTSSWLQWGEFITSDIVDYKIAQSVIVQNLNSTSYVSSTPISSFPNNKVTITVIPTSRATGFPRNAAGLLTTYRFGGNGYDYQEYKEYAENRKWIRTTNADGTWGEWKELSNI